MERTSWRIVSLSSTTNTWVMSLLRLSWRGRSSDRSSPHSTALDVCHHRHGAAVRVHSVGRSYCTTKRAYLASITRNNPLADHAASQRTSVSPCEEVKSRL